MLARNTAEGKAAVVGSSLELGQVRNTAEGKAAVVGSSLEEPDTVELVPDFRSSTAHARVRLDSHLGCRPCWESLGQQVGLER